MLANSGILVFGIRNTSEGIRIPLTIGIRNQSSSDKESGIHGVESRIQDCLGFPYIGQYTVYSPLYFLKIVARDPALTVTGSHLVMVSKCTKGVGVEVYSGKNWIVIFKLFCALLIIFAWKRRVIIFNHYYYYSVKMVPR